MLTINSCNQYEHFEKGGKLSQAGKAAFFHEIDDLIQHFDLDKIKLRPAPRTTAQKPKQSYGNNWHRPTSMHSSIPDGFHSRQGGDYHISTSRGSNNLDSWHHRASADDYINAIHTMMKMMWPIALATAHSITTIDFPTFPMLQTLCSCS